MDFQHLMSNPTSRSVKTTHKSRDKLSTWKCKKGCHNENSTWETPVGYEETVHQIRSVTDPLSKV